MASNKICGVYKITSPSGRFYIGSSVNIRSRWSQHRAELRKGTHHCSALQKAAKKYGVDALSFEVIEECSIDVVRQVEQTAIDGMKPSYNSTNCTLEPLSGLWKDPEFRAKGIERSRAKLKEHWLDADFVRRQREGSSRGLSETHKRPEFAAAHKIRAIARLTELVNTPEIKTRAIEGRRKRYESDPVASEQRRNCGREMMSKLRSDPAVMDRVNAASKERMTALRADADARERNLAAIREANGHRVRCIETGEVFASIGMAAASVGKTCKNTKTIAKAARGDAPSAYGFTWAYEPRSSI